MAIYDHPQNLSYMELSHTNQLLCILCNFYSFFIAA